MYQIEWTPLAESSYQAILDFVFEQWSIEIVIRLDDEVKDILGHLERKFFIGSPVHGNANIRKCVISKQTSLIYRIIHETDTVELITFVDNRSNHPFFNQIQKI